MAFRTTLSLLLALCTSCSDPQQDESKRSSRTSEGSSTASTDDATDDGSDEPEWVNGAYLTMACGSISSDQDKGRYVIGCQLNDGSGKRIDPTLVAKSYAWKTAKAPDGIDVSIEETRGATDHDVRYTFGSKTYVAPSALVATDLSFAWREPDGDDERSISVRVESILTGLANLRSFRLVLDSIRVHDAALPVQTLSKLEFKVDGRWLELTYAPSTGIVSLGGRQASSNGTIDDILMFPNIFGMLSPLRDVDTFPRYSPTAPHDPVTEPLYLEFSFAQPKSITGFRYNGGEALTNRNMATGFPDVIHFENRKGGIWTVIKGSEINVDLDGDEQILQYFWSGSDF